MNEEQTEVLVTCFIPSAPTRLIQAEWGSGPREGEGHGGCYDNFIMVFERLVYSTQHL